ncbi:glycoside-pentoside-hexuronide (GPH):cation symporter [Paucilactobacillus suebicus]|uniref:Sugar transporter n=1 Tax=Paucilactobacillus suebicus DSM 5007 = KCTC 3549 TaxID=1423807 RepID=A0A0R1W2L9_9LACO|nr:glycoside-pentoside-hexuronide (GPH):cation symporter [Paucilactobacillus suebicus]KRM11759.1 sugar transporter [Paucilactobacillus suebicus DSM 5007 = KCTC 3549]
MENTEVAAATAKNNLEPRTLTFRNKIGYAIGDVGNNFLFDMGQLYLLNYFTDQVGLPSAAASMVFLIAKIWDAFADISVGTWIDNRRNIGKRGKFRPFILWAAIPLALLLIANFSTPNFSVTGKLIWAYIAYMLFGTCYSISNVPFGSMIPTMTRNSQERSELASYRAAGSNFGLMMATIAFMPIVTSFSTKGMGYTVAVLIFAVCGVACQWISYANIKEVYKAPAPKKFSKTELKKSYKALLKNKPLVALSIVNVFTFSAFNLKLAVQVYYCEYILKNTTAESWLGFFSIGMVFVSVAITPWLTKHFDKKVVYMMGCAIWAAADIAGFFMANSTFMLVFLTSIAYLGDGFTSSLNWALISDCVEYGEWQSGIRSEGLVYSAFTYFRKLSQAIAGFIPGIVLAMVGYVPNQTQTASALLGIRGLMFIYSAVMAVATIGVMFWLYPLTEKRYKNIVSDLTARRQKKAAQQLQPEYARISD